MGAAELLAIALLLIAAEAERAALLVVTASLALTLASLAREFAAAAASRASSIWRSRLASSSFSNCNCSCCDWGVWRHFSIAAAMAESDLSDLLASLAFSDGPFLAVSESASFGESANAIPEVRNKDSVSAASFFIASLFRSKFKMYRSNLSRGPER